MAALNCSARITITRLLLIAIAVAVCCVPACALGEWRVKFELALERYDYHEGEAIHAGAMVTNISADAIRMAFVSPINERLVCAASREDGTRFVDASALDHARIVGDQSMVLDPGEGHSRVVALRDFYQLDQHGEPYHHCEGDDPSGYLNRQVVVDCSLPPGRYTMRAQSDQRSCMLAPDTVVTEQPVVGSILYSNTISFTVWPQGSKLPSPRGTKVAMRQGGTRKEFDALLLRGLVFAPQSAFEQAGAKVAKDSTTVALTRGKRTCELALGRWRKGGPPPAVPSSDGSVYLPLRAVAQALGLRVNWNPVRKVAVIRG